jgi:hypothetical protein
MAETAEILRERGAEVLPASAVQVGAEAPARPAFPDLAAEIMQNRAQLETVRKRREEAVAAEKAALERRETQMAPVLGAAAQTLTAPREPRPGPLALTPPPSRQLTDFLAPVQGEHPATTISKLIQGIGLLATGFTGLARGAPTAALAALQGALQGWHEGDKERADRHFKDWQAKTDAVIAEHEDRHRRWREALEDTRLTRDQQMSLVELEAIRTGYGPAIAAFGRKSLEDTEKFLRDDRDTLLKLQGSRERLAEQYAEKRRHEEFLLELKRQGAAEKKERDDALVAQYTGNPEVLKTLGEQWAMTGKMPSGLGVGRAGAIVKQLVAKAGVDWAKERGLDPMSLPTIQAEVNSAKAALTKLRGSNALQMAAIKRLDGHLDALVQLSEMVPRGEIHLVNRAIIAGQRNFQGSPEAAAFVFQSFEVGMELARVVVGTAQGDAHTREEARQAFQAELGKGQVKAVVEQARQNAHRNLETNLASEKELAAFIDTVGGRTAGTEPPKRMPPPPGRPANDPLGIRR